MNAVEEKLRGTTGYFLAWIFLPLLPFFVIQPFIAFSVRLTLPFFFIAGLLCLKSRIAAIAVAVALTVFNAVLFLSITFRLTVPDLMAALFSGASKIDLFADPLYAALAGAAVLSLSGTAAIAWKYRPRPSAIRALGLLYLALILDFLSTGQFGHGASLTQIAPPEGARLQSATMQSGFDETARKGGAPSVLVLVEAFGRFEDSRLEDAVIEPLLRLKSRTITRGHVSSYGSTTAAELRELCGIQGTHGSLLDGRVVADDCLPRALVEAGMAVTAVHGFSGSLFERTRWYPQIGLHDAKFGIEALPEPSDNLCSSVFRGPCDFEIARTVDLALKTSGTPFVYWLTLNSHIPARPHPSLEDPFDCPEKGGPFGDKDICGLAVIWRDLLTHIAAIATSHPDAQILVVGDHPPPVLSRRGRALFDPRDVPWIFIPPEAEEEPQ